MMEPQVAPQGRHQPGHFKKNGAKKPREGQRQPQIKYGAGPAANSSAAEDLKKDGKNLIIEKALLTPDHYSYFYYHNKAKFSKEQNPLSGVLPDILYSQRQEGEIVIEWNQ